MFMYVSMRADNSIEPIDELCDCQGVVPDVSVVNSRIVGHRSCSCDPEDHRGKYGVDIQQRDLQLFSETIPIQ